MEPAVAQEIEFTLFSDFFIPDNEYFGDGCYADGCDPECGCGPH